MSELGHVVLAAAIVCSKVPPVDQNVEIVLKRPAQDLGQVENRLNLLD